MLLSSLLLLSARKSLGFKSSLPRRRPRPNRCFLLYLLLWRGKNIISFYFLSFWGKSISLQRMYCGSAGELLKFSSWSVGTWRISLRAHSSGWYIWEVGVTLQHPGRSEALKVPKDLRSCAVSQRTEAWGRRDTGWLSNDRVGSDNSGTLF